MKILLGDFNAKVEKEDFFYEQSGMRGCMKLVMIKGLK
jgi:hypothetical protein